MANDLIVLMDQILARSQLVLRELVAFPRLVNNDYSMEAQDKGDTIKISIPAPRTAKPVNPGATPPEPEDAAPSKVDLKLDQWYHADFKLTDKELAEIEANSHFIPGETLESVRALANQINQSIAANYVGVYGFAGTPGVTPFSTDEQEAIDARQVLNDQLTPRDNLRRMLIDSAAEAKALKIGAFKDASASNDPNVITEGNIGRKLGFDWFSDDHIPVHQAGTAASYQVNDPGASLAVGDTDVPIDTGTGNFAVGDIVTFAGHTQTYAVTEAYAGGAGTLKITPGLKSVPSDGAAVTRKDSHVVNLAFHRNAFGFASRPLLQSRLDRGVGRVMRAMPDEKTGIVMRLELITGYKQTHLDFDVLWGSCLARGELATRVAG